MASSFSSQIPGIIHLITKLNPSSVLDIGKGFGKYGFLIHEYLGIDNKKKINNALTLRELSSTKVDAVEIDKDLMLPYLKDLYDHIYMGDITKMYAGLPKYDLVLMIDIIEHIEKVDAINILKYFLKNGTNLIIATPRNFFLQELYESVYENHVSHWKRKDFIQLGHTDSQYYDAGAVYLLTPNKLEIRGFGNSFIKKIRRLARALKNEF